MNIQIFGLKNCFDTKKAERYFKERKIKFQYIDIKEKAPSKRELQSIIASVGDVNKLINSKAKEYKLLNMEFIRNNDMKAEILLNNPKLYKTPIVRNGNKASVGYEPEAWTNWE